MLLARLRTLGRGRFICASLWLTQSPSVCGISISLSVTSHTNSIGPNSVLKLYDYLAATTRRGLPARWLTIAQRRAKQLIKQTPPLWALALLARSIAGELYARYANARRSS